ncbi:unnamed protein product [marine sediment metagenome]|uniref:Uncharacterized protein n=1 Tax=marine sediment metagenome TaxID=412755 RepID=X0T0G7_9ZZZZ
MPDPLSITPLGAAVVEAMPDRKAVAKARRAFKRGECPTSVIFPTPESIAAFYAQQPKENPDA